MKKIICLYGQPGCGKGTQADFLVKHFGYHKFGMGERLRAEIATDSTLGRQIKPYVDSGLLIPDELMLEIIKNAGQEASDGLIFDGFPRIVSQAKMLDKIMGQLGLSIDAFIYLHLTAEKALERIKSRAILEGGRTDDIDTDALKNRFAVFDKESVTLLDYYRERGKLYELDGGLSIPEISTLIIKIIKKEAA